MEQVETIAAIRRRVRRAREHCRGVELVPTMGALHEGHLALVRAAAQRGGLLVVSIFVNPTQFAPGEDYAAYPRDLDGDVAALAGLADAAPDVVYAPTVAEMYPSWSEERGPGIVATVRVERLAERLCGASRPGHFEGVCTVVTKLLNQVQPDRAYFGRKDFQQLQVLRRMVRDLDVPVGIVAVPTVREDDGLAMSSRNAYLADDERTAALALSHGLADAVRVAREARRAGRPVGPEVLRRAVLATLADEPLARVDYVEVVDPGTLAPPASETTHGDGGELLVAVAAYVGAARLIDNVVVGDRADEERLLEATG